MPMPRQKRPRQMEFSGFFLRATIAAAQQPHV
jgi:hypothetical protein